MSLLLRFDPERQVLASLGDPPHGLVCAAIHDDGRLGFAVNPSWQPDGVPEGLTWLPPMEVTEVAVPEVVAGCADGTARRALWKYCAMLTGEAVYSLAVSRSTDLRPLVGAVELWSAVADAFEADGGE